MESRLFRKPSRLPLRVVVAGTPNFAVPTLRALHESPLTELVAVYTQPDRSAGRGRQERGSAVKEVASEFGLVIEQPSSWREAGVIEQFAKYAPDLLIVAAYGLILPSSALAVPSLGSINVHASLLPRWRGAAPIQRALMAGDAETGITIMEVVPALDAGPMLLTQKTPIADSDTAGSLELRLSELGAAATLTVLKMVVHGDARGIEQDSALATYASKLTREERILNWAEPAEVLARRVRALNPAPLATTEILGLPLNVWDATLIASTSNSTPGTVVEVSARGIDVATGLGLLRILRLQPPGKRPMTAREFINGYRQKLPHG